MTKIKKPAQQIFERELTDFIKNHPYYKETQGTCDKIPERDKTLFTMHDPDGDYEVMIIEINMIP